jgi:SAM-dependent methyltransferase
MNQDPISETLATYDEIAVDYAERWQERGILNEHMDRFSALLKPGSLVCDIGCGPGFDTAVLHERGFNAIGLDRSWGMMQAGRTEHGMAYPFVQVDMRQLPLGKTAVDGLWLCASLLHLPREDVASTLQNFAHILKPGGILYLTVKMGDDARWMPNPYKDDLLRYFTYWQPETLDPLIIQAGFQIVDGWQDQGKQDCWLVRFAQKSSIISSSSDVA